MLKPLLAIGILATSALSAKADTVRHYLDIGAGGKTPVTIIWKNIQGLDSVRGTIYFGAGEMSFTGWNSRPGKLTMNLESGYTETLTKVKSGNGIAWVGKEMKLIPTTRGGYAAAEPQQQDPVWPKPLPLNRDTVRTYQHFFNGVDQGTCTIRWANISGNGKISGTINLDGQTKTFTGSNPRNGVIEMIDDNGHRYHLVKRKVNGQLIWEGTVNQTNDIVLAAN